MVLLFPVLRYDNQSVTFVTTTCPLLFLSHQTLKCMLHLVHTPRAIPWVQLLPCVICTAFVVPHLGQATEAHASTWSAITTPTIANRTANAIKIFFFIIYPSINMNMNAIIRISTPRMIITQGIDSKTLAKPLYTFSLFSPLFFRARARKAYAIAMQIAMNKTLNKTFV